MLILIYPSCGTAQTYREEYRHYISKEGVDFYYRWKRDCNTCEESMNLKIVNKNTGKKDIHLHIQWLVNGNQVGNIDNNLVTISGGSTQAGDIDGKWYLPPKGYTKSQLQFRFVDFYVCDYNVDCRKTGNSNDGSQGSGNRQGESRRAEQMRYYLEEGQSKESGKHLEQALDQYQRAFSFADNDDERAMVNQSIERVKLAIAWQKEIERQQYVNNRNQENSVRMAEERQAKQEASDETISSLADLGNVLFSGSSYNRPRSQYIQPSYRLTGYLGVDFECFPVYINEETRIDFGNGPLYDRETGSRLIGAPGVSGGIAFYPYYSNEFALGAYAGAGIGYISSTTRYNADLGGKLLVGLPALQFIVDLSVSMRSISYSDYTAYDGGTDHTGSVQNTGSSSDRYLRLESGLRYSWNSGAGEDVKRAHLDLLYTHEAGDQHYPYHTGNQYSGGVGAAVRLSFDNGMAYKATVFPGYSAIGDIKYDYMQKTGWAIQLGVWRTLDVFGGKIRK